MPLIDPELNSLAFEESSNWIEWSNVGVYLPRAYLGGRGRMATNFYYATLMTCNIILSY